MTYLKILLLLVFVLSSSVVGAFSDEVANTQIESSKKLYTVIEFESSFMNRRREDILKTLGEPDSKKKVQGKEVWKYKQVVMDKEKIWDQNIMFDFGRVNYMWLDRPSTKTNKNF